MKRIALLILLVACTGAIRAQSLTLEECQELAAQNYPVIKQLELIDKTAGYNVANARRNWLPQLSLSAQATYQSEVMSFPDEFSNLLSLAGITMEGLPRDQYKAAVELQQVIWDGGLIGAQVGIAKAESEVDRQTWEVEMYKLRERVNELYFGALLLQQNICLTDSYIDELNRNMTLVESYAENGVATRSDIDKVRVELLSARQRRTELTSSLRAFRLMLGVMTGMDIPETAELVKPEAADVPPAMFDNRPELKLLSAHEGLLEAQRKGVNAGVMPRIGAFAQFGYGNPGLNLFEDMIKNRWSTFYVVGARLEWTIGSLYTRKNKLSQIELGRANIDTQRETFLYNMRLKNLQESIALERMREVMREDDEIIELRAAIRSTTEKQIEHGTATVSDLLRDAIAENAARQNKAAHEIEMLKGIYDMKYTTNN